MIVGRHILFPLMSASLEKQDFRHLFPVNTPSSRSHFSFPLFSLLLTSRFPISLLRCNLHLTPLQYKLLGSKYDFETLLLLELLTWRCWACGQRGPHPPSKCHMHHTLILENCEKVAPVWLMESFWMHSAFSNYLARTPSVPVHDHITCVQSTQNGRDLPAET